MKYLITLLLCSNALASPYIEWSLSVHDETSDSFHQRNGEPIKNIIGSVEIGYEFEVKTPISVFVRHSSSVQQEDTGLNTLGIKVRIQ